MIRRRLEILSLVAVSLVVLQPLFGGSATWSQDPTSGDWNTAANWTPETIPNNDADTATFNSSAVTSVTVNSYVDVGQIIFNPGSDSYTIAGYMTLQGVGVTNNSGTTQYFELNLAPPYPSIGFSGTATAGNNVVYTAGGIPRGGFAIAFGNQSNAGSATFIIKGDSPGLYQASLRFTNISSAGNSTIINESGDTTGGITDFDYYSSAANSTVTTYPGASLIFHNNATGGNATLIADGGGIFFQDESTGGQARIELTDNGILNCGPTMTIGSVEGDSGVMTIGAQQLTVGGNGFSTTFGGLVTGKGALIKTGSEPLL